MNIFQDRDGPVLADLEVQFHCERPSCVQRHVRSRGKRVLPGRAAEVRPVRPAAGKRYFRGAGRPEHGRRQRSGSGTAASAAPHRRRAAHPPITPGRRTPRPIRRPATIQTATPMPGRPPTPMPAMATMPTPAAHPALAQAQPSQTKSGDARKPTPPNPRTSRPAEIRPRPIRPRWSSRLRLSATTPNPVAVAIPVATGTDECPCGNLRPAMPRRRWRLPRLQSRPAHKRSPPRRPHQPRSRPIPNTAATDGAATHGDRMQHRRNRATATATAKIAVPAAAGEAVAAPVIQQAPPADATPANAAALTSAVGRDSPRHTESHARKVGRPASRRLGDRRQATTDPSATSAPAGAAQGSLRATNRRPQESRKHECGRRSGNRRCSRLSTPAITAHDIRRPPVPDLRPPIQRTQARRRSARSSRSPTPR